MSTDMMGPTIPWTHTHISKNRTPLVQRDERKELNRGLLELWT